jgi:molybdopterin-guanine dinucleotide biosynthesis protein A
MTSRRSPEPRASRGGRLIAAAILAGGRALRLQGAPKPLLVVDGAAIVDRQLAVLAPRFSPIFAVLSAAPAADEAVAAALESRGLRITRDGGAGLGPMAGLHAALRGCEREWLFVFAGDMPFLEASLIDWMAEKALGAEGRDADALVVVRQGRPEPLHALYRTGAEAAAETCLRERRLAMTDLLGTIRTRWIDDRDIAGVATGASFRNVNTPEDLSAARGV